jgi:hypothetical protein
VVGVRCFVSRQNRSILPGMSPGERNGLWSGSITAPNGLVRAAISFSSA